MHILKVIYSLQCSTDGSCLETPSIQLVLNFIEQLAEADRAEWTISIDGDKPVAVNEFLALSHEPGSGRGDQTMIFLEKRNFERHDMRVQVTVMTGSRSFTTYSENLSKGGLLLERAIPATMRTESARVFLVTPKKDKVIELKGKITGNIQDQKRIAFLEMEDKTAGEITSWIERKPKKSAA